MNYSQDALDLITECEGFKAKPYICGAGQETIGYGHALREGEVFADGLTTEQALKLLQHDLIIFCIYLNQSVKVTLKQCQYDALCSLVFNWGCFKFGRSKGLRLLNQGKVKQALIEFFSKEKGVVNINGKFCQGLLNRRIVELKLWNKGEAK